MRHRIKYISHYGCRDKSRYRYNSPASDNKKDYIFSVLNRIGYGVDHISRASSGIPGFYLPAYVETVGDDTFRYFASFGKSNNKYLGYLNMCFIHIQFFLWLLLHLKRNETIIVYHSLGYTSTMLLLKRLKNLEIIGEVEELYQDVSHFSRRICNNELRFINACDKYIFPTDMLNRRLNKTRKPYLIVHGVYTVPDSSITRTSDSFIHVVYAGTFDPRKGGALAAAAAAACLPEKFYVHICGFGSESETFALKSKINEINKTGRHAKIIFEGLLSGQEYIDFIHSCQIGLSVQDPSADFNNTSFPSKVLSYLSNGLAVVSAKIPAVESSKVSDLITFYDKQTPDSIAEAILKCDFRHPEYGYERLSRLDSDFREEISELLRN